MSLATVQKADPISSVFIKDMVPVVHEQLAFYIDCRTAYATPESANAKMSSAEKPSTRDKQVSPKVCERVRKTLEKTTDMLLHHVEFDHQVR
jgi:hypothetical protein